MGAARRGGDGDLARADRRRGQGRRQAGRAALTDTIVALSSGRPPAAIAIIRMSGPAAFDVAATIAGRLPPPHRAGLRPLRDGDGALLDRALVLRFAAGASATGEDLVEFHCHGGVAVVRAVERVLLADERTRPAVAGEFTRRALENGRIDLAQAQGLADLLAAETEIQRRQAIAASEGHVSRMIRDWLDRLVGMSATVEALIDYGDEGDVVAEADGIARVDEQRRVLAAEIAAVLAAPPVERWRDGIRVVLAGPPNTGKSTLLNALAGREAAIVSPIAGTTRDVVEVAVQRDGIAYVLSDTAGLHEETHDPVERIGMAKARQRMAEADLVLWLGDSVPTTANTIRVHARVDLPGRTVLPATAHIAVSAADRHSIGALWAMIAHRTGLVIGETVPLHRVEQEQCRTCLDALNDRGHDPVLLAESLRLAVKALSAILGDDAGELVLDRLFARFCVGK